MFFYIKLVTHLRAAQPVSVPMPPPGRETSYATAVVMNYETEIRFAITAGQFGHAMNCFEHAGKKKDASQHARLFATERKK